MKQYKILKISVLLIAFFSFQTLLSAQGLDLSFGNNGVVITSISNNNDFSNASALQSDGKIVLAGSTFIGTDIYFSLARYNTDGSLDNTFDGDGSVVTNLTTSSVVLSVANAVAIQTDGKIIAGGYTGNIGDDYALARYNTDGSLDNTFDSDGKLTTDIDTHNDKINAIAIQNDGKIVVAGYSFSAAAVQGMSLARYNTNGSLDNTFDNDGKVFISTMDKGLINSIKIQADGKIVAVGEMYINNVFYAMTARFNTDGSLDNTFDGDGIVNINLGYTTARSVVIQSDGKIVVLSKVSNNNDFVLTRYNQDGSLDSLFDADGIVITDFANSSDDPSSIIIQSDGKLIAGGTSYFNGSFFSSLARYNTDGSLDNTFDIDGLMTTPIINSSYGINSLLIQNDGNVVASGFVFGNIAYDHLVTRYDFSIVVTKIEDINDEQTILSTYPNPTQKSITIEIDSRAVASKYLIVNQLGQVVLQGMFDAEKNVIDVQNLTTGVYFLQIEGKGENVVKIVKE